MAIEPYKVHVSDTELAKLKEKLSSMKLPDELQGSEWDMGTPLADVRRLALFWRDEFDWRKNESGINKMPQFKTIIQCKGFEPLEIHFVHQRSTVSGAIPLLFCHGWPGSFLEVQKLLPLLTASESGDKPVFHVVAPSLPNFGFSSRTEKRGFGLEQYAETCHQLMLQLGYTQYVTQGGDWGFQITRTMGLLYPSNCRASHVNGGEAFPPTLLQNPVLWLQHLLTPYSAHERAGIEVTDFHHRHNMAYDLLHQTKPQTLAFALTDSPVALLAWLYEKLHDWTDDYPWAADEILTWVSVYWHSTAGVAASLRLYYESNHAEPGTPFHYNRALYYIPDVKYGISHFPKDLTVLPNSWAATLGDVILQTRNPHGGHFAAVEHPEIMARDLRAMVGKGGKAYGCVKGLDGYAK